jgi:hypothetical protein
VPGKLDDADPPQRITEVHRAGRQLLALGERQRPGVAAVQVQQVEQLVEHGEVAQQLLARADRAEPLLQPPEPRLHALERHDFPSATRPPSRCASRAAAISGKVPVMSRLLRLISRTPLGSAKARHRSPSSFRSNTHAGDKKRSLVRVASCGSTQEGSAPAIPPIRLPNIPVAQRPPSDRLIPQGRHLKPATGPPAPGTRPGLSRTSAADSSRPREAARVARRA